MKADFLFAGLNLNIFIQKKRENARFLDNAFETK